MTFSKFIHAVACISTSFFSYCKYHSIVRKYHILLTHSSTDGHLGYFHFSVIVKNAVRTFVYEFLCGHMLSVLLGVVLVFCHLLHSGLLSLVLEV